MLPQDVTISVVSIVLQCLQEVFGILQVQDGCVAFSKADYVRLLPHLTASGLDFFWVCGKAVMLKSESRTLDADTECINAFLQQLVVSADEERRYRRLQAQVAYESALLEHTRAKLALLDVQRRQQTHRQRIDELKCRTVFFLCANKPRGSRI